MESWQCLHSALISRVVFQVEGDCHCLLKGNTLTSSSYTSVSRLEVVTSFSPLGVRPSFLQVDQKEGQVFLLEEEPMSQHDRYCIVQEAKRLVLSC